jgi:hypothetical protein
VVLGCSFSGSARLEGKTFTQPHPKRGRIVGRKNPLRDENFYYFVEATVVVFRSFRVLLFLVDHVMFSDFLTCTVSFNRVILPTLF